MVDVRTYSGIIDYQPRELVLTVKAGTPIHDIDAALDAQGQMQAMLQGLGDDGVMRNVSRGGSGCAASYPSAGLARSGRPT